MCSGDPPLLFEELTIASVPALHGMLKKFAAGPNASHFSPHSFELDALQALARKGGQDLYFVAYLGPSKDPVL